MKIRSSYWVDHLTGSSGAGYIERVLDPGEPYSVEGRWGGKLIITEGRIPLGRVT